MFTITPHLPFINNNKKSFSVQPLKSNIHVTFEEKNKHVTITYAQHAHYMAMVILIATVYTQKY